MILSDDDFEAIPSNLPVRSTSSSSSISRRSTRCCTRSPTTWCPRRPARRRTRCCGRRSTARARWAWPRSASATRSTSPPFVPRRRLRPRDDVLADEIREADFGGVDVSMKVRPNELDMAQTLIDNLSADGIPASSRTSIERPCSASSRRRSTARNRGRRGGAHRQGRRPDGGVEGLGRRGQEGGQGGPATKKKAPARKKTAAKKPAAKKPAAKKPAARKKAVGE